MRYGNPAARPLALFGSMAALLLAPAAAQAATITVGTNVDAPSAICTLRDAITAANTDVATGGCVKGDSSPTVDTINFSLPAPSTITLGSRLPVIYTDMNIAGPGAGQLSVSGVDSVQIANVDTTATTSVSGVTLTSGRCALACGQAGGALTNFGILTLSSVVVTGNLATAANAVTNFSEGGGIENNAGGVLNLVLSSVTGNTATSAGGTGQNVAGGGGIMNRGTLTVDRSTVSGNHAIGTAGGGGTTNALGGGIQTRGPLAIARSTISGNTVSPTGGTGNAGAGGGIGAANSAAVTISLDRTTVSGNSVVGDVANAQGGGILSFGTDFTVSSSTLTGNSALDAANVGLGATNKTFKNTIVSNPLGGGLNCGSPTATSLGFNIEDTNSCGFGDSTDQHTDPLLAALADNGGPTQTMALLTGSPAIDQGLSTPLETTDQRVLTRPVDFAAIPNAPGGDGTDVGAFEVQAPVVPPPPSGGGSTAPVAPDTVLSAHIRKPKRKATFTFGSADPSAGFMCKLDKRALAPCTSPVTFKHLREGKHKFMVEAVNAAGTDPSPAIFKFKLKH